MGGMALDKKWSELSFSQKRHRIYHVVKLRRLAFWRVVSKEAQKYFASVDLTADNVDSVKDELLNVYLSRIEDNFVFNKEDKINFINKLLGD